MSVRLPQAPVHELLAAIEQLEENGFQCGDDTFEVQVSDLRQLRAKARTVKMQLGYVQGAPVPQSRSRARR